MRDNNVNDQIISNNAMIEMEAISENESFARVVVASFVTSLDPTLEEISDIKTAVSEAVTNCIIHGYDNNGGTVVMRMQLRGHEFSITIEDKAKGIEDIKKAMEPMYTSCPSQERSGMGFVFMEAFMDELSVESTPGQGTKVHMKKIIQDVAVSD